MRLPLYKHNEESLSSNGNNAEQHCNDFHPGLKFDKFPEWQDDPHKSLDENVKPDFLKLFTDAKQYKHLDDSLEKYHQRRKKLIEIRGGNEYDFKTDWRLVSGLGSGHPYETGLIWHRTLGVPYLSGSSIKGILRSWLTQWEGNTELAEELFGNDSTIKNPNPGKLIILDAIPETVPSLELDILNPHYQPYYNDPKKPPADYYNPIPVYFLTVAPNQTFTFQLMPRSAAYNTSTEQIQIKKDLEEGKRILIDALENIGSGGKTAVGYGIFKKEKSKDDFIEKWIDARVTIQAGTTIQAVDPKDNKKIATGIFQSPKKTLGITAKKIPKKYKPGGNGKLTVTVQLIGNKYILKEIIL